MLLIYLSAAMFAVAGGYGANLLWLMTRKRPAQMKTVFIHGGLALAALTLLIVGAVKVEGDIPFFAVLGMIFTAMGGLMLFALRRAGAPVPFWAALLHPLLAILSMIFLLAFLFGSRT